MTIGGGAGVPAGWYPDPADAGRLRRWDGQGWTEDVTTVAPVAAPAPEPITEPQRMPSAPSAPPAPPRSPSPPLAEPEPEPEAGPEPDAAPTLPEWATLPGLTLPPDLSGIPGFEQRPPLPTPHFADFEVRVPPTFPDPEPADQRTDSPRPDSGPQTIVIEPDTSQPSQAATPPLTRRDLRGQRAASSSDTAPTQPDAPYAPPPTGGQFSAPPPPGIAYTPPPPESVQPASALPAPPTARQEPVLGAPLRAPQFDAVSTPATPQPAVASPHPAAQAPTPVARPRPMPFDASPRRGTATVGVWLVAVLPLLQFAAVYVVFSVLAQPFISGSQWGILIAPAILGVIFAAVDRRRLTAQGHGDMPPVLLGFIPPLYLVVRLAKLGIGSLAPLIAWIVLQAAAVAGVLVLMPAVLKAAIGTP